MKHEDSKLRSISDLEEGLWSSRFVDDDDFFSSNHYRTASKATHTGLGDLLLNGTLICIAMAAYAFHLF